MHEVSLTFYVRADTVGLMQKGGLKFLYTDGMSKMAFEILIPSIHHLRTPFISGTGLRDHHHIRALEDPLVQQRAL